MVLVRADYIVSNSENVEQVKTIIREFMLKVKQNEPDTLRYRSFQEKVSPRRFSHLVGFKNEQAEQIHKNSIYNKEFTSKLYPLCEALPKFIYLDEVSL